MEPWYKNATPRNEVRQGRSFDPDEFAIHSEPGIPPAAKPYAGESSRP